MRQLNPVSLAPVLFFSFPLFGNSIKSWTGVFFFLVLVMGLFVVAQGKTKLHDWERRILMVFGILFFVIVASCLYNGWEEEQTKGLGVFVRTLAFIPIYLLVRSSSQRGQLAFAFGCVFAAGVLILQGFYEIYWLRMGRADGIYESPGLFAGQALVCGVVCYTFIPMTRRPLEKWILVIGVLLGLVAVGMSGSRSTYFVVLLMGTLIGLAQINSRKGILVFAIIASFFASSYGLSPLVKHRVDAGISEISAYHATKDRIHSDDHASVGTRFELWRVATFIISDHAWLGVGWRNFSNTTPTYVASGLASPVVLGHRHPHNMYLETVATTGLLGGLVVLALLALTYRRVRETTASGKVNAKGMRLFLLYLIIAGINEGGLFIYGNSLSFYLVVYAVLLARLGESSPHSELVRSS